MSTKIKGSDAVRLNGESADRDLSGIAAAWVNFDGTASGAAARDSLNLSSMTDNGTGDYTISWSVTFTNNDYQASFMQRANSRSAGINDHTDLTTTGITNLYYLDSGGTGVDRNICGAVVHGDLA